MRLRTLMILVVAGGISTVNLATQEIAREGEPRFETYCSRTVPGNSQVELQWPVAPQGAQAANLAATARQQVLDITVYKEGFERRLYKTIRPGATSPEFQPFGEKAGKELPGLQKVRLTQFATSQEAPKQGLRMSARPLPGRESAIAKLEGLEPGMKYFVRISSSGVGHQTLSFTAAVCPADYIKPPKRR
jgi:hypothetical protein